MNGALFKKELRSLRPFLWFVLVLLLLDIIDAFLTPFEARSLPDQLGNLSGQLAVVQIFLGFALGSSMLVREIDDGTMNFLDGLPLTRNALFVAKVQAAILVLTTLPAGLLVLNATLHLATRESLDYALHPALLLTFFSLSMLVTAVSLTAGMLLGFLRTLSWLVLALCALAIKLLEDTAPALAGALNTAELLTLRFTGTAWQLPLPTIWTQLSASLLFGGLSFVLFKSAGSVLARVKHLQTSRRLIVAPVVATMLCAAGAGVVMLASRDDRDGDTRSGKDADAVAFTPMATGHARTTHYTFSYPTLSSARAAALIARADQTFLAVAALLKMDAGAPIDVDLAGTTENHEGTAYHDRIRMHVRSAGATATLAHETAHVFAARLAGGERGQHLAQMTVFNEGLAEWVEGGVTDPGMAIDRQERTERHELAAAVVAARRLLTPRQLTDYDAFVSAVDDNLKYPLGAIFIDRFVTRYGPEAPKTLLETLAREDFPRDLVGYTLWQAAFQLARFDLDLVLDDYARYLKNLALKYAPQIAQLPRPRGSLVTRGRGYSVALRFDLPLPPDTAALVRFRPGKASDSARYRTRYSVPSKTDTYTVMVPGGIVKAGEICLQPGLRHAGIIIYEPWVCLPVSSSGPG